MLYPTLSIRGGSAEAPPGQVISADRYRFDRRGGVETVWIIWSPQPHRDLEGPKRWVTPEHQGELKDPEETGRIYAILVSPAAKDTSDDV